MTLLPKGLSQQLLIVAAVLYALVCTLAWLIIETAVEGPARRAVESQMENLARELRGRWTTAQITGSFPTDVVSGELYWSVTDEAGGVFLSAVLDAEGFVPPSLVRSGADPVLQVIASPIGDLATFQQARAETPPMTPGTKAPETVAVTYSVAMSAARYGELVAERARALKQAALSGFAVFSALMLGLIVVLVTLVLRPLRRLERAAEHYGEGENATIEGEFPSEIQAVVDNLNASIDRNAKLVERTRRYIGKIAHDLKHPLAVTQNALSYGGDSDMAKSRLNSMGAILDRYAQLATSIGPDGPHRALALRPFLEDARDGFLLLYRSAPLTIDLECDPDLSLRIAESDLDAIVANLMTNAHRHAKSRIMVSADAQEGSLTLAVEDDGPGLDEEAMRRALSWGERLDTSAPGSGFGLAIVADLASLYGGRLTLDRSKVLGGLSAKVSLNTTG
ncbi:MAG: HAMP domain-containing sensor histidine kinase [Pseudomonadota bacterium]